MLETLDSRDFYNAILVRGRRSAPTFEQVRKEAREVNSARFSVNLYR